MYDVVVKVVTSSLFTALSVVDSNPTWDNWVFFVSVSYATLDLFLVRKLSFLIKKYPYTIYN